MKYMFDMDGVLFDWEGGFQKMFGDLEICKDHEKLKQLKQLMPGFGFYEQLAPLPLIEVLKKHKGKFGILTSVGKYECEEVALQKQRALKKALGYIPPFIWVQSSGDKAQYATNDTLLIDDRDKALIPFSVAGGAILRYKGGESQDRFIDNLLAAA